MSHVIKAVLRNPSHPEYGQITIPFPIPLYEYDQTIEMLQAIELGFSINRDSMVDEVESPYKPLALLKNTMVNVDQLDYLAKRLAGFCAEETSQFQAMAYHLNLRDIKDLINLTFCCQVRPEGFEPPAFWSVACLWNGDDFFQPCLALFFRLVMSLTSHPLRLFRRKIFCSGSDYGSTGTEPVRLCTPLFHRHLPAREQLGEMRERNPVPVCVYRKGVVSVRHPAGAVDDELAGLQDFGLV